MSETNPSLVASELAKISTFETETEKRKSTLTLNELNYISDKQLHKKGGGSGDSPIKLADVRFTSEETRYDGFLQTLFNSIGSGYAIYTPETGNEPEFCVSSLFVDEAITIDAWNSGMLEGLRFIAPMVLIVRNEAMEDGFEISITSGDAELRTVEAEGQEFQYLYITGDCVINVEYTGSET